MNGLEREIAAEPEAGETTRFSVSEGVCEPPGGSIIVESAPGKL